MKFERLTKEELDSIVSALMKNPDNFELGTMRIEAMDAETIVAGDITIVVRYSISCEEKS